MDKDMWLVVALLFGPALAWMFWGTGAGIVTAVIVAALWFFSYDFKS